MSDNPKYPPIAELLERVVQLERKSADLQAQLDDLGGAFEADLLHKNARFKSINECITDIHDFLWPLVYRVFPGFATAKRQVETILNTGASREDDQLD